MIPGYLCNIGLLYPNIVRNKAVSATMTLVDAPTLPPLSTLVGSLANELDAIKQDYILVLDNIHYRREKSVHHFLNVLLRHPPRPMHLGMEGDC